jgi:hypothetical protein
VRAVVLFHEARGLSQARLPGRLVPFPRDPLAVAREPAAGAEREAFVHAQPELLGALGHVLALAADVEHGRDAAPEQLGHGEVDARPGALFVLRAVANGQVLEESRVPELRAAAVLDERAIERRAAEVRMRADEARGEDAVARVHGLVDRSVGAGTHVDDGLAFDHHHAVAEQAVAVAVERNDPSGFDRGAADGGGHGPRSVPSLSR